MEEEVFVSSAGGILAAPESIPGFEEQLAQELAAQAPVAELTALASVAGGVPALNVLIAKQVTSIQGGVVQNSSENDLQIIFNPQIPNPTFVITNMWNENGRSSDIGYSDLGPNGVTVRRGYSMSMNGLQDFSWVAMSLPVVAPIPV